MSQEDQAPARLRWARLRFSIIGPLLSCPPESRALGACIKELSRKSWRHPTTAEAVHCAPKTIEHWYYTARSHDDPLRALERTMKDHRSSHSSM